MGRPITARQEAFALAYIRTGSAAEAAREAGYSPRSARASGPEILSNPAVAARVAELKASRFASAAASADQVLGELSLLAREDIAQFLEVQKDGTVKPKALKDLLPGASRCIRKVKVKTSRRCGEGGDLLVDQVVELELWDKLAALDALARYHGLYEGQGGEGVPPAVVNITFQRARPPADRAPRLEGGRPA